MTRVSEHNVPIALATRRPHFVGIGGCGMSGLAQMAKRLGAACTGSDLAATQTTDELARDGIEVAMEQTAATVPDDCELLVISAAITADHPELVEARRRGIAVMKYAELLGQLMLGRHGVAVAGTHGKSTTTSMLAHILIEASLDPSFIVGAHCATIGGGWRVGESELLVVEACEYDRSFHHLNPRQAVILNVEADHLDIYSGLDEIVKSFTTFARRLPPAGTLLINHEMPHRLAIAAGLGCRVETIGFAPQSDWRVESGFQDSGSAVRGSGFEAPRPATEIFHFGHRVARWASPLPGEHMAYNAAAAAVMANQLGADWPDIGPAIESFGGLDRRMQLLGTRAGAGGSRGGGPAGSEKRELITVIDDYGHHPTEIDTTLRALRRHYQPIRLICVFQPHQHSRTRFLMEEFAASFSEADIVIVPEIYFVRDSQAERQTVTADDLVKRLRSQGVQASHMPVFGAIVEHLQVIAQGGDLLVTMGAGDVWKVAHEFLNIGK